MGVLQCRGFSNIPGVHPQDASSIPHPVVTTKISADITKCPLGYKMTGFWIVMKINEVMSVKDLAKGPALNNHCHTDQPESARTRLWAQAHLTAKPGSHRACLEASRALGHPADMRILTQQVWAEPEGRASAPCGLYRCSECPPCAAWVLKELVVQSGRQKDTTGFFIVLNSFLPACRGVHKIKMGGLGWGAAQTRSL